MFHFSEKPKTKREFMSELAREGLTPARAKLAERNTLDFTLPDGERRIRLHGTDVLTFPARGGFVIRTGGYNTVTTRARINAYLPRGASYVGTVGGVIHYGATPFNVRLTVGPRGAITPDVAPSAIKTKKARLDSFMAHVKRVGLPTLEDSAGDPWVADCASVSAATALDWIDSNYMTRRLYALALQFRGTPNAGIAMLIHDKSERGLDNRDLQIIRRYLRSRIGLAS